MTHENDDVANKLMFRESFFNYNYMSEILSVLLSMTATILVILDHKRRDKNSHSSITGIQTMYTLEKVKLEIDNPVFNAVL